MKGKKKTLIVPVLLLLVGLTCGYVANTYAKYAGEIKDNEGTATVAKWAFTTDNASTALTLDFADTYDEATLVDKKIAPGTKGSFNIKLVNTSTETGVDYTVKLKSAENRPTNLKFYKDETRTAASEITPGTGEITGQLAPKDGTGVDVKIYWEWPLGANSDVNDTENVEDTADGTDTNLNMSIIADITGVQTTPVVKTS